MFQSGSSSGTVMNKDKGNPQVKVLNWGRLITTILAGAEECRLGADVLGHVGGFQVLVNWDSGPAHSCKDEG